MGELPRQQGHATQQMAEMNVNGRRRHRVVFLREHFVLESTVDVKQKIICHFTDSHLSSSIYSVHTASIASFFFYVSQLRHRAGATSISSNEVFNNEIPFPL